MKLFRKVKAESIWKVIVVISTVLLILSSLAPLIFIR